MPKSNLKMDLSGISLASEKTALLLLEQIIIDINKESRNDYTAQQCLDALKDVFLDENIHSGGFDFIESGSFKECYELGICGWVIKFCSTSNETDLEEQILSLSGNYDCAQFFVPTYFVKLPFLLSSTEIITDGDDDDSWDGRIFGQAQFNAIEIQKKVSIEGDYWTKSAWYVDSDSLVEPILYPSGEIVPPEQLRDLNLKSYNWIEEAILIYGEEAFKHFLDFAAKISLTDLHLGNIGYFEQNGSYLPVIIDWLSVGIN